MAPSSQETQSHLATSNSNGDRVVISGMSGLYPKARHVKDFSEILYEKVDPITTDNHRWDYKHPDLPIHIGMVPDLNRFDAQFFKLSNRNGYTMDVMARKLLEQVYQAIYDAGMSPEHLRGKNIGVYVGSCFTETEKACFYHDNKVGTGTIGCCKSMFANRISYWLDVKGPSYAVDQSCCSSIAILETAYQAIDRGECEAAIVAAGSVCIHPQTMIHFSRLINMSANGKTKSFDENADGCVKSEAINALFLQKAKSALRIYADVVHVKSIFTEVVQGEDGPKFGFYRNASLMAKYMKEFYKEANISPNSVEYVEAFGAGDPEIDKAELDAFEEVFCENRNEPLVVGSVMSNIGYTEAASGIASITKVLIGYQKGKIAANLNCNNPRQDIPALKKKRMVIATEHHPILRSYIAINNLSYNGVNAHVLLHGHLKPKNLVSYKSALPRLVTISGRHEKAVKRVFDNLKDRPIDPEELALLNNIHEKNINGHLGRGYAIFDTDLDGKTINLGETIEHFDDTRRPLWFVYNGVGTQWNQMGMHLMHIPTFAATIKRCHEALIPNGIDLIHILTNEDKTIFDSVLNMYVGITAVQIGLTNIMKEMGIVPDKMIGHSMGEISCGYADGALTLEQAILASYARGRIPEEIPSVKGGMVAVGLGYQQIKNMCPSDIFVACHNGPDSCTLSGTAESVKKFLPNLISQGIFAKEVNSCNIAFHTKYLENLSMPLLEQLKEVIKNPIARSQRWVSTSVPQESWHEEAAKYSSPEYFVNNMMNPVLFEEALKLVPSNAVLIEIGPQGLLQSILKRSLSSDCRHIPLVRRGHTDNVVHLLNALGRLYMAGYNPQVAKLYPKVEFPVSTETASLSHLIDWTHDEQWDLPLYISGERRMAAATKNLITLHDSELKYLQGNIIRGQVVYPFAAVLVATWDTLAMSLGLEKKKLSVHFRDVHLFVQPILHQQRQLKLNVLLHRGTGKFEVSDEYSKVATGYIVEKLKNSVLPNMQFESTKPLDLDSKDVYELLQEKDYSYRGDFCSIFKANASFTEAQLLWTDNWVTFIDGILQLNALKVLHDTIIQPSYIRRLCIDVDDHKNKISTSGEKNILTAHVSDVHDLSKCGGILIENIKFQKLSSFIQDTFSLKTMRFVPHFPTCITNINSALEVYIEILRDNIIKDEFNVVGIKNYSGQEVFNEFKVLMKRNSLKINYYEITLNKIQDNKHVLQHADLILTKDILNCPINVLKILHDSLQSKAFILNLNTRINEVDSCGQKSTLYRIMSSINTGNDLLELIKLESKSFAFGTVVPINTQNDVFKLSSKLTNQFLNKGLLVVAINTVLPGLKEQVKKWRKEFENHKIAMITTDNDDIMKLKSLENIPEFAFSVLKNGLWGGEYLLPWEEITSVTESTILQSNHIGNVTSLKWLAAPEPIAADVVVNIHYAGLNDCDVKRATGVVSFKEDHDFVYGMDFSGKTPSGTRVMGLISSGALASKVVARRDLLWDVPRQWSLEDAATVPLAYSMAFYCLKLKANIARGMTVLILGGAGALGQAVISIALAYDCKVFTTVSDPNKKKLLLKLFPKLDENTIGYSRGNSFRKIVLKATKGRGCDIVITCAAGELKDISLNCCASFGVTIDTVQIHCKEFYAFSLSHLSKQRSYMAVDFTSIFDHQDDIKRINGLIIEGIAKGYVQPLTYVTFDAKDVSTAFKLLESTRRNGRVLIRLHDSVLEAESRFTCSVNNWQLVFADDVIGIQFTENLIKCGARKILLNCSSQFNHLQVKIRYWTKLGAEVEVSSKDLTKTDTVNSILERVTRKGSVEGIFVFVINANNELEKSIAKLDYMSRKLCPSMKNFVISSTCDLFGKNVDMSRKQAQLPMAIIHLPPLQETNTNQSSGKIRRRAAIDATMKVIVAPTANVHVYPNENKFTSLITEIASIAGIKFKENIPVNNTLQDLGIFEENTQAIKVYLKDVCNTYLESNEILSLTVQKIHDIEKRCTWFGFENLKELQIFYSHVASDEALASAPVILMKTRAEYTRANEFDVDFASLCIIPGLEGHHDRFQLMCERLKLPAFTLQPGYMNPRESILNMAQRFAQVLMKKMKIKNNFYILGYESGVLLALETAKILEMNGRKGTIFCVGQTPEELKITIEDVITTLYKNGTELEDAVAKHMVNLIKDDNNAFTKIETEVKAALNWNDKLEICVEELVGHNGHTSQYIHAIINAAFERIIQLRSYEIKSFALESKIVLLHSASTIDPSTMQRFSKQPISVHDIDCPLGHLAKDLRCTSIINQHLSQDVLDLFEKNDLCEKYLFNGNTFSFVPCPE